MPCAALGWLALCRDRDGTTTLRRATISTRPVDSPVAPTVRLSARPCRDAPLVLRAKAGLDADRALPTATIERTGTRADGSATQVALFLSSNHPRRLVPAATTFFGGC